MLESLTFALNATMPIFLMMVLGYFLRQIGWVDEKFANQMNKFVFRLPLPVLLFSQLAVVDIRAAWDTGFVLFCVGTTILSIVIAAFSAKLLPERSLRGEMIQVSYRSSAALLGVALISNLYGSTTVAPLMILVCYDIREVWTNPGDRYYRNYNSGEQDASIAATTMMYEAEDLGVHTIWIRDFDCELLGY